MDNTVVGSHCNSLTFLIEQDIRNHDYVQSGFSHVTRRQQPKKSKSSYVCTGGSLSKTRGASRWGHSNGYPKKKLVTDIPITKAFKNLECLATVAVSLDTDSKGPVAPKYVSARPVKLLPPKRIPFTSEDSQRDAVFSGFICDDVKCVQSEVESIDVSPPNG
jgi:hypothetical protein